MTFNQKEYGREWYIKNRDRILEKQANRRRLTGAPPRKYYRFTDEEKDNIVYRLLNTQATTRSIALEFGCAKNTIEKIYRDQTTQSQRLASKYKKQSDSLSGQKQSEECVEKKRIAMRGDGNPFYGKKHSPLTRELIAVKHRGKTMPISHKIGISAYYQNVSREEWREFKTPEHERLRKDSRYTEWRLRVFKRDNYTCRLCDTRGGRLHAHHIKRFTDYPELRFEVSNGITLCIECHRKVTGNEEKYETRLRIIISGGR